MKHQKGWQPHGEQFVMACAACEHERKSPVCSDCLKEKRSGFVPKKNFAPTNADRIRAMSDEELAKWMAGLTTVGACNDLGIPDSDLCDRKCESCCLAWLRRAAEEEL